MPDTAIHIFANILLRLRKELQRSVRNKKKKIGNINSNSALPLFGYFKLQNRITECYLYTQHTHTQYTYTQHTHRHATHIHAPHTHTHNTNTHTTHTPHTYTPHKHTITVYSVQLPGTHPTLQRSNKFVFLPGTTLQNLSTLKLCKIIEHFDVKFNLNLGKNLRF